MVERNLNDAFASSVKLNWLIWFQGWLISIYAFRRFLRMNFRHCCRTNPYFSFLSPALWYIRKILPAIPLWTGASQIFSLFYSRARGKLLRNYNDIAKAFSYYVQSALPKRRSESSDTYRFLYDAIAVPIKSCPSISISLLWSWIFFDKNTSERGRWKTVLTFGRNENLPPSDTTFE